MPLSGKKVLLILPCKKFKDREFQGSISYLLDVHSKVVVASSGILAEGIQGTAVTPDILIDEVSAEAYDALLLVGGVGSIEYWHDERVLRIINEASGLGIIISAICLAPITLANAGILKGLRTTAYPSAKKYLESKGAVYTGGAVEVSGKIITGRDPEATLEFVVAVARKLGGYV